MTVKDVIKLLREGDANKKIVVTYMNSESNRSHSVFTCTIGSHWKKDFRTHLRFVRLNWVDLAGSVRQKGSGAEGDRLKEAVYINKSLSTIRLAIMSLTDLGHERHRHVPYKDSRLTFLLQDSLDGNSKTMVIANVSHSIGSASETLGALRFAQCAKLIQSNAKVNEDASDNVSALQKQIEQLKDQLSFLMKIHYPPGRELNTETSSPTGFAEQYGVIGGRTWVSNNEMQHEIKGLGATLVGSLRRERDLQQVVEKLRDEIANLKLLVMEKDEEANRVSLILKLREDIIKRLTVLTYGDLSAEVNLLEQNRALMAEIHLLQEGINRDPELIQLAMRNTQLTKNRIFYELGKREHLLAEVSGIRSQLL